MSYVVHLKGFSPYKPSQGTALGDKTFLKKLYIFQALLSSRMPSRELNEWSHFMENSPKFDFEESFKKQRKINFLFKNALGCSKEPSTCHWPCYKPSHAAMLGKDKKKPLKKTNLLHNGLECFWEDSSFKLNKEVEEEINSSIGKCVTSWLVVICVGETSACKWINLTSYKYVLKECPKSFNAL